MRVERVLRSKEPAVVTVSKEESLEHAAKLLHGSRIGSLVVLGDKQEVIGILSERDIVRVVATDGEKAMQRTVASAMTLDVVVCAPQDTLEQLMTIMTDKRIRHLPVIDDGSLVGIVSIGDVVKLRLAEITDEAKALSDYITLGR
jgi:CBS domain-containing protein